MLFASLRHGYLMTFQYYRKCSHISIQGVFFILTKYILKLLGPQSTEEAGLGQNLFLRSWEIFWLPWLWYPSYLTTQYNGLLFGFVNGQNTTYSHVKIGKMVHKDKKRAASGDTPINGTPRRSRSSFMGLRSKVRLYYTGITLSRSDQRANLTD